MAHPVPELEALVRAAVAQAFGPEHANVDPAVHRSAFADFQADVALRLARTVKRPPLEVAKLVAEKLDVSALADEVKVSPPGFLNFSLRREYLEAAVAAIAADPRVGVARAEAPETVVIDYSAPNVAKEMHVGHLRATVVGDSIARLLAFGGHRVIRQNHIGDWGTPFGMLIEHLIDLGVDAGATELAMGELKEFYQGARKKFDSDPAFAERSRTRVVALQAGDEPTLELWRVLVEASRRYFREVYSKLGALLVDADERGESFYNPFLDDVARDLEASGIARVDDGALCVFLEEFKGREGEPTPLIVRKKDGGYGYAATDLAGVRFRTRELGAQRILYVVGAPQQQHFAQVFAAAKLAGYLDGARAEHVPFGAVLGSDRKMFRTRSGETPRLIELLDEAVARADAKVAEKSPDLPPEVRAAVAKQIGMGALKYADLSTERIKDYVFDWDRMISFEGNTGPYLQYAHARISSILRKAGGDGDPPSAPVLLQEPAERALALELMELRTAVNGALATLHPHRICTYSYELATKFTAFYDACPVIHAPTPELRASRLVLVAATRRALAIALDLLGISAPDRM